MKKLSLMAATALLAAAAGASGRELDLSKNPLFLGTRATPNLALTLDDSGSMRAGFMPEGIESGYVSGGSCTFRLRAFLSSKRNTIYYNPQILYTPPLKPDGSSFPNVSFDAAPLNGYKAATSATVNLGTQYFPTYEYWDNGSGHLQIQHAAVPPAMTPATCAAPTAAHLYAVLPFATAGVSEAFYYQYIGNGSGVMLDANYEAHKLVTAQERQNFANWYSYYRTRSLMARGAVSTAFATVGPGIRVVWQNLTNNKLTAASAARPFEGTTRATFFDWLYNWTTSGLTPLRAATIRVGEFYSRNGANEANPYWDPASGQELSCRSNFHLLVTDGYWNEQVNPTDMTGDGDRRSLSQFPDGSFAYGPNSGPESKIFWNENPHVSAATEDCRSPASFTTPEFCDPSLADIAFHYWATDLRPDLPNTVLRRWTDLTTGITGPAVQLNSPVDALANKEVYFNPRNDPANWQHMSNFIVGMGLAGTLPFPQSYDALRAGSLNWPTVKNASSLNVDDAWHAAINSRGQFLMANDSQALSAAIAGIIAQINDEAGSSTAPVVAGGVEHAGNFALVTSYDTRDWTGDVAAVSTTPEATEHWSAAQKLNAKPPQSRVLITSASAEGQGIAFRWNSLSSDWQAQLNDNPDTALFDTDGLGEQRLEYLRGAHSSEEAAGGPFRTRLSLLGAVVHGGSALVGAPAGSFDESKLHPNAAERDAANAGDSYSSFVTSQLDRKRVAYVASNDGFLHAFDAGEGDDPGTGEELWGYIPFALSGTIAQATRPTQGFLPTVDSTPVVRDVFIGGAWRTVLLGALRRGGQAIYALDITEPELPESAAADRVLWELGDAVSGAARLGFTYGKPNIVRLGHGRWVALIPGGYNNESVDAAVGDGKASLFVVDIETGDLIRELNVDSYGLSFATSADNDGDGVDDFAVAGDVVGNLWRFDLQGAPASWSVEKLYEATVPEQYPITAPPRIFGDVGGSIVLVGTGKFLEPVDRQVAGVAPQRILAVRERGKASSAYPWQLSDLTPRTLQTTAGPKQPVSVTGAEISESSGGWTMPLTDEGERIINAATPVFSAGIVIFESLRPGGDDPCASGVAARTYVLSAGSGLAPTTAPMFDTDGDGDIDSDDAGGVVGMDTGQALLEGTRPLISQVGGGIATIYGNESVAVPIPVWRRRYWKELIEQ